MGGGVPAIAGDQLDDGTADDVPVGRALPCSAACSGVEMPKPTAQGMDVDSRTSRTRAPMSVVISLRTPVTPREETIYKKPVSLPCDHGDAVFGGGGRPWR